MNTEQAAAMALLDRGAGFYIPAPFLYRIFGKNKIQIVVRRLRLGTLLYLTELETAPLTPQPPKGGLSATITELVKSTGAEMVLVDLKYISENMTTVCRVIAACLLNSKLKIKLFRKPLGRYLKNKLTADQLQELTMWLFVYGRVESFTNTIKFIQAMQMTKPMNLSPTE